MASGAAEVDLHEVEIRVGESFWLHLLESGNQVPHLKSVDTLCTINRKKIDIHLKGNFLTEVVKALEVVFKGPIAHMIEKTLMNVLATKLPTLVNNAIDKSEGILNIPLIPNWAFDF